MSALTDIIRDVLDGRVPAGTEHLDVAERIEWTIEDEQGYTPCCRQHGECDCGCHYGH